MRERPQKLLELLERWGPSLYTLLTRLTLREDVAEDLMQELFVRLNSSRAFNKAENPPAYAHKAAANLALDWRRKQAREPVLLAYVQEPGSNDNSPLSNLAQKEQLEETLNAISQLSELYRETLVMRYIQQNSYEEIAQALGREEHHVRALCSRAIGQLRDLLASDKAQSPRKGVSNG